MDDEALRRESMMRMATRPPPPEHRRSRPTSPIERELTQGEWLHFGEDWTEAGKPEGDALVAWHREHPRWKKFTMRQIQNTIRVKYGLPRLD